MLFSINASLAEIHFSSDNFLLTLEKFNISIRYAERIKISC